jgi:hypothetical protein
VCNLYSMTTNVEAIRRLFQVDASNDKSGNLPAMPGVFPDYKALIVRNGAEGRELAMARWGMPSSSKALMDALRATALQCDQARTRLVMRGRAHRGEDGADGRVVKHDLGAAAYSLGFDTDRASVISCPAASLASIIPMTEVTSSNALECASPRKCVRSKTRMPCRRKSLL